MHWLDASPVRAPASAEAQISADLDSLAQVIAARDPKNHRA